MVLTELIDITFWSVTKVYSGVMYLVYGDYEKIEREKTRKKLDELTEQELKTMEELHKIQKEYKKDIKELKNKLDCLINKK